MTNDKKIVTMFDKDASEKLPPDMLRIIQTLIMFILLIVLIWGIYHAYTDIEYIKALGNPCSYAMLKCNCITLSHTLKGGLI